MSLGSIRERDQKKLDLSAKVAAQTAEFLARGGKIVTLKTGLQDDESWHTPDYMNKNDTDKRLKKLGVRR